MNIKKISKIDIQKYERYLPSSFDSSLSMLEKVNKVIYGLEYYSEITMESLLKWNEVYEWLIGKGLDQAVSDKLSEWLEDGTLKDIINDELFDELNQKIEGLDDSLESLENEFSDLTENILVELNEKIDDKFEDYDSIINSISENVSELLNEFSDRLDNANVFIGRSSGTNNSDDPVDEDKAGGYRLVGVGENSLMNNVRGWRNTALGHNAMKDNVDGYNNTAVGDGALEHNIGGVGDGKPNKDDGGSRNTAVGSYALRYNETGVGNTGVGRNAGHANKSGNYNTAVGTNALSGTVVDGGTQNFKNSSYNTAIGYNSLFNTNEDNNIGIGFRSLYFNEDGTHNIAIGNNTNIEQKDGNRNISIGSGAMRIVEEGSDNVMIGSEVARSATEVNSSTAIGDNALRFMQNGEPTTTLNHAIGIGKQSRVSGDSQLQLGTSGISSYSYGAIQQRSDERDKTDISDSKLGLSFIELLEPKEYVWDYRDAYISEDGSPIEKDGSKKRTRKHQGFIAQDIERICEFLGIDFGGLQYHGYNGGNDVYSLGYEELIPPMVNAIKELSRRLSVLENKENE